MWLHSKQSRKAEVDLLQVDWLIDRLIAWWSAWFDTLSIELILESYIYQLGYLGYSYDDIDDDINDDIDDIRNIRNIRNDISDSTRYMRIFAS